MILDSEIRDQAYQFFIQEALEFLQELESGLLNLQHDHDIPAIHALMRAAHSIKGGAASVGLESIQHIAHRLEDVFRVLYSRKEDIEPDLEELLLQAFDRLREPLLDEIQAGGHDAEAALKNAEPVFAVLEEYFGEALQNIENELPSAAELGVDIVLVIFSGDVPQGLERLETVLATKNPPEIQAEFHAQAEVFAGVGELLNLSGFVAIAKTTIAALDHQPLQAQAIGQLAYQDFKAAHALVMGGDRSIGGQPSPALAALAGQTSAQPPQSGHHEFTDLAPDAEETQAHLQGEALVQVEDLEDLEDLGALEDSFPLEAWDALEPIDVASFFGETPLAISAAELENAFAEAFDQTPPTEPDIDDLFQPAALERFMAPAADLAQADLSPVDFSSIPAPADFEDPLGGLPLTHQVAWGEADPILPNMEVPPSQPLVDLDPAIAHPSEVLAEFQSHASLVDIVLDDPWAVPSEPNIATPEIKAPEIKAPETKAPETKAPETTEPEYIEEDTFVQADSVPATASSAMRFDQLPPASPEAIASWQTARPPLHQTPGAEIPTLDQHNNRPSTTQDPAQKPSEQKPREQKPLTSQDKAPPTQDKRDQPVPFINTVVRVDMGRLERLNNLVGELVTQENSAMLQNQQLQTILRNLEQRIKSFELLNKNIKDWSDRSHRTQAGLQKPQFLMPPAFTPELPPTEPIASPMLGGMDLDVLQMDAYSGLHNLLQETVEEMAQVQEAMRDLTLLSQQTQQTQRQKQQTLKQVRNDLLWARMLPVGDTFQRFPRMVRDLAHRYNKSVAVKITGNHTLVDKSMLEKLYDPLVHLVRNAFDHGVEAELDRTAQGKSAQATIELRAYHRGNQTYIEVRDDGQGINLERVRQKAISQNLIDAETAGILAPDDLYEFLFAPGFSTASEVSELSGRGVGLDTVRSQVRNLKGSITLTSQPGQGSTFTLRFPLTLTIANLLVFSIQSNLLAIPVDSLLSIVSVNPDQIQTIQDQKYYRWQDQLVPLHAPQHFLRHYPLPQQVHPLAQQASRRRSGMISLLLIAGDAEIIALPVEHILHEQELVIKPFGPAMISPSYLYGCTILGDGSLVPVIDGQALLEEQQSAAADLAPQPEAQSPAEPLTPEPSAPPEAPTAESTPAEVAPRAAAVTPPSTAKRGFKQPMVLVVDDSLTARHSLAATLKKAGYHVLEARDGQEALQQLQQNSTVRAVFCDVEMPRMNGFEFLTSCRQHYSASDLPVIMLTSRGGEKHRKIAKVLGATGYLTKPYLEQEVLKTLKTLIDH